MTLQEMLEEKGQKVRDRNAGTDSSAREGPG